MAKPCTSHGTSTKNSYRKQPLTSALPVDALFDFLRLYVFLASERELSEWLNHAFRMVHRRKTVFGKSNDQTPAMAKVDVLHHT